MPAGLKGWTVPVAPGEPLAQDPACDLEVAAGVDLAGPIHPETSALRSDNNDTEAGFVLHPR